MMTTPNPIAVAIGACRIPHRPKVTDEHILGEIAQRIGKIWHDFDHSCPPEMYARDIKNVLRRKGAAMTTMDGYDLARAMEDDYSMDLAAANALDAITIIIAQVLKEYARKWVEDNGIVAPYPNATRVMFGRSIYDWQNIEHGTIHLIDGERYSETAESPIVVDGHPNGRRIVAWELLELESTHEQ